MRAGNSKKLKFLQLSQLHKIQHTNLVTIRVFLIGNMTVEYMPQSITNAMKSD